MALYMIFKGLKKFTHVCELVGIIKPLPFGEKKLIYENRLSPFEFLQIPRYNTYE